MINIVEHLEKYPTIRLPNGHQYFIKGVEVGKCKSTFKQYLGIRLNGLWIAFTLEDLDVSWKFLRQTRREVAVRSEDKWRIQ